ncbi:MAG: glycosyltransferase family 9 protein [Aeromonas sp.]
MRLINQLQLARDILRRQLGRWLFDKVRVGTMDDGAGKVVLVRWDAKLGDAIVSSWVAREIHKDQPDREVWVITTPAMAPLFRDHFGVDRVVEIRKRPGYRALKQLARDLGKIGYIVHFAKQLKMKDIFFLNKVDACHIVGIDDELACIDMKLGKKTSGRHFAEKFSEVLKLIGITSPDTHYIVPKNQQWESSLTRWWPINATVIAFNPYGNGKSRRLTTSSISAMLEIMLSHCTHQLCLLFPPGMEDEALALKAAASMPERVIISPDKPTIGGLFTQIRHCMGLVSVDTATVHIAAGLSLPILGLYNPGTGGGGENYREWHPNTPNAVTLFSACLTEQNINTLDLGEFEREFSRWITTL